MSSKPKDGDSLGADNAEAPKFEASLWCIRATGGRDGFYTHGYPTGKINPWPHAQFYQSKAAAVRQLNVLKTQKWFETSALSVLRVTVSIRGNQ